MSDEILNKLTEQFRTLGNKLETDVRVRIDAAEAEFGKVPGDLKDMEKRVTTELANTMAAMQDREAELTAIQERIDSLHAKYDKIPVNTEEAVKAHDALHTEAFFAQMRYQFDPTDPKRQNELREFKVAHTSEIPETRDMLAGIGTTGGFLVPDNISTVIRELYVDTNMMRQEATVQPISVGDSWTDFREKSLPEPSHEGETSNADEDEVEFFETNIKVHPIRSIVPVSEILLMDVPAMESMIQRIVGRKFLSKESVAQVTGNGVLKATGFTFGVSTDDTKYVRDVAGNGTQLVSGDDFADLFAALEEPYEANAKWYMNKTTLSNVMNLKDAVTGGYLIRDLETTFATTIRGIEYKTMFSIPSEGDEVFPLYLGDMRQAYMVLDRSGITLLNDPYTDYPVTKFKFSMRSGGGLIDPRALVALKTT